jgi:hypothetical protein
MPAPVLVTGVPRSGTTWVGRTLTLSGELGELYEPFNPAAHQARWFDPPEFYLYVEARNAGRYGDRLTDMSRLHFPLSRIASAGPSPDAMKTALRTWRIARGHRLHDRTAMVKDPLALFSTQWLAAEVGFRPVILVRHPAAFVSSVLRVGWQVRFGSWLRQPLPMDSLLAPWAEQIARAHDADRDLIRDGALLWAVCNDVVRRWRDEHPDWLVVRHEDLAADPERAFAALYGALGLSWNETVADAIGASTNPRNPAEISSGAQHELTRDSRSIAALWRSRLSDTEIRVIRSITSEVGQAFYGDDMWA